MKYKINKKTFKEINHIIENQSKYSVVDKKQFDFTRFRKEQEFTYSGLLKEVNLSDDNHRIFHHKKFLITGSSINKNSENNRNLQNTNKDLFIANKQKSYLDKFLVKEILIQLGFYFKLASIYRGINFDVKIPNSQQFFSKLLTDEEELKKNLYIIKKRKEFTVNSVKSLKRSKSDKIWFLAKTALKKETLILNKVTYRNTLKSIVNQIINNEKKLTNIPLKIVNFYKKYKPEKNLQLDVLHEIKPESRIVNYNVQLVKRNNKYFANTFLYNRYFSQRPLSVLKLLGFFNKKRLYNFGYLNVLKNKNLGARLFFFRNLLIRVKFKKFLKNRFFNKEDNKIIPVKVGTLVYSIKNRIKFHCKKKIKIKKYKKKYKLNFKNKFDSIPSFDIVRYFSYKKYFFSSRRSNLKKSNVFICKNKFAFNSFLTIAKNTLKSFDLNLLEYLKGLKSKN